jgi:hypothetical protein
MPTITNFGDSNTTGNTTLQQNLTVQGAFSQFYGNILSGSSTVGIGNVLVPFANLFSTNSNITYLNTTSIETISIKMANATVSNALTTTNIVSINSNISGNANIFSLTVVSNVGIGMAASGNSLSVNGNAYVSNTVTTQNIFTRSANIEGFSNTTILIASNIGIGTSPFGNALSVQGNVYISNSLTTTNIKSLNSINATTTNTSSLIVSSSIILGGDTDGSLTITGNLWVSNAITTGNFYATRANLTNLSVTNANISLLNALSVSYFNLNVSTLNTSSIYGRSGYIDINAPLQIQGNVYASNGFSGTNLAVTGTIYYNEDLFKRGPYLTPSVANAATIRAWISATCNASSQPTQSWWATSSNPVYGNAAAVTESGSWGSFGGVVLPDGRVMFTVVATGKLSHGFFNPYTGTYSSATPKGFDWSAGPGAQVLLPNGNVVLVPQTTANVGMYNPVSNVFSNVGPFVSLGRGHIGAVLAPDGNVICAPYNSSNIGVFNPTTSIWSNVNVGTRIYGFTGAVLTPSGNVVFVPWNSSNIGVFNPSIVSTTGYSNVGPIFAQDTTAFLGGVLTPSGNVVFVPYNSSNVIMYNPSIMDITGISNCTSLNLPQNAFRGGALLPSGNVVFAAYNSANIGMYSPITNKYSNAAQVGNGPGSYFNGAVLVPDGRVVFCPSLSGNVGVLNTMVPAPREFCMNPFFNKF